MSQAQLLTPPPVSLPPITYKGQPVVTTEMLAQAYGCSPKNIRDNFANNRERFVEGKHFFTLTSGELKTFRDYTENFGVVVPARTKHFTIYTERGSLQHAKSIGTDEAWSVYDVLVESFFRVAKTEPAPSRLSTRTDPERKALTAAINAWVGCAPIHYAAARSQVNAHFGVASVDELTVEQVREALQWVQGKIDALDAPALPSPKRKALPPAPHPAQAKADALLAKVKFYLGEIAETEKRITDIAVKAFHVHHPDVCIDSSDLRFQRHSGMSCATRSLWTAIDFNLKALEASVRMQVENCM